MLLFIAIFLIMLKRREVLLININGITPEPEIQARYTVHKKRCVSTLNYGLIRGSPLMCSPNAEVGRKNYHKKRDSPVLSTSSP